MRRAVNLTMMSSSGIRLDLLSTNWDGIILYQVEEMTKPIAHLVVIYDGGCPFCTRYVSHVRLQNVVEQLQYVNARDGGAIVAAAAQEGFDLNDGMLVVMDGVYHHGADAVQILALLSSPVSAFNRLHARMFRSRTVSRLLYPALRFGRNASLRLLGRPKLLLQRQKR